MFVIDTGFAEESAIRRKREHLRNPVDALRLLNIDPAKVTDVILTHLHYDHAGNLDRFPSARYHVQDREVAYATGRSMCHHFLREAYDLENALEMVRKVYSGHAVFHDGESEIVPGLTLHHVGGHTAGLQIVRVWTQRGWVVLAADAAHPVSYTHLDVYKRQQRWALDGVQRRQRRKVARTRDWIEKRHRAADHLSS